MDPPRRHLPARSTRGKRKEPTAGELQEEEILYQQIFRRMAAAELRKTAEEHPEGQGPTPDQLRKSLCAKNFKEYPFVRGIHFFVDLNTLPILKESYVDHLGSCLGTYKRDADMIGGTPLGTLLNRKYIGLPKREENAKAASKSHNQCHAFLFECEDKRYHLDRILAETHFAINNFQDIDKLSKLNLLARDIDLQDIFQSDFEPQKRKAALTMKSSILSERKVQNFKKTAFEEALCLESSVNQSHFNAASYIRIYLEPGVSLLRVFERHNTVKDWMSLSNEQLLSQLTSFETPWLASNSIVDKVQRYHYLSQSCQNELLNSLPQLMRLSSSQQITSIQVNPPSLVLPWASQTAVQLVDRLLAVKLCGDSESAYYCGKAIMSRILGRTLELTKETKKTQHQAFLRLIRRKKQQLRKFILNTSEFYPCLDRFVDKHHPRLLKTDQPVQITPRDMLIIWYYSCLCHCAERLVPLQKEDNNIADLLASEFFGRLWPVISEILGAPELAWVEWLLRKLCDLLAQPAVVVECAGANEAAIFFQNLDEAGVFWTDLKQNQQDWEVVESDDQAFQGQKRPKVE